MNIATNRRRNLLIGLALAVSVLVLTFLALRQVARFTGEGSEVWVASAGLGTGTTVGEGNVRLARIDPKQAPPGVIRSREQIQGRQLARRKQEGSPFVDSDFIESEDRVTISALTETIPDGRVLMPLRITPHLFPAARLRRGDRVDILASDRNGETQLVVRDGFLLGQSRSGSASAPVEERKGPFGIDIGSGERRSTPPLYMYLALHPEDALTLSRAQSGESSLKIILHSRNDVLAGRVSDLGAQKQQTVELIRGGDRETVPVAY